MRGTDGDEYQTAFITPKQTAKPSNDKLYDMLQQKLAGIEVALIHIEEIMAGGIR